MKKIFFYLLVLSIIPAKAYLQESRDTLAPYLKSRAIPDFKILQLDSTTYYTRDSLPAKKPIVIIYFSTECNHCQYEAKQIAQHMDSLSYAYFVWIDYHHSINEIAAFGNKYGLSQFSNIKLGKEIGFKIIPYYRIEFTPFIAVYERLGHRFIKEFREPPKISELYNAIETIIVN